ncbi:MAG: hypothetical protein QXX12_01950 [Nanopusillaceae archaeon]
MQLPLRGSNVSSINVSNLNQNCVRLIDDTRKYTFKILEKGFPYHYTIGLFQTETNCRWLISRDGVGSIGYAQITPSMWDRYLLPYAPNYKVKDHPDHIIATKILLKHYMQRNTCNKLWITYQIHNGGFLILRECKRANSCEWKDCKNNCRRRDVCVLFDNTTKTCKQFRNACEITYSYSQKVHQYGLRYKNYIETKYKDKFDNKKYTYW